MKRRKINKHFSLNKQTVANLTDFEQERVLAGGDADCILTECVASKSAVLFSSSEYVNTKTDILPANPMYWPCFAQGGTTIAGD